MNTTQARIMGAGLFFLLIFISGFWLSSSGKPYSGVLFTLHKLIAVAAAVFLGITVTRMHQVNPLDTVQIIAIGVTGACFIGTIVSGGLLSTAKPLPQAVTLIHHLFPYVTVLSTAGTLYLLMRVSREIANAAS